MVAIKKRRTPEVVIEELVDEDWRRVFHHPLLRGFAQDPYHLAEQRLDAAHILDVASKCKRGTLSSTPLSEKVFIYLLCFTLWRVFGKSLLTDHEYASLARHLWGGVMLDKINHIGTIPLKHRSNFIWLIPKYGARYRGAKSIPLSSLPGEMPEYATDAQLLRRQVQTAAKRKLRRIRPKK